MIPTLSVKSNIAQLARDLRIEREDLPKRVATALTRTAIEVRKGLRDEMQRVFDRPTPYTLNSFFVKPATAADLTAIVWLKERNVLGGPHYLEPQIFGGARTLKPFEQRLQRIGALPAGMFVVPGEGAKLDRYGNMNRGQLVQILSQLRAFTEAGYDAHPTKSRRSQRNVAKAGRFFVGRPGGGRLPLGVWQRIGKGAHNLKPVLIFVRGPRYSARFKFYEVSERIAKREFPLQFERAAREAAMRRALPLAA
jgi:hypothetical protein